MYRGGLCHDLGQQFRSPTVNLTVKDFLRFCENLKYYLSLTPTPCGYNTKQNYPICQIEDIKLDGVHYHSHEEMISVWEKRKQRINWDNIFIIATDEYIETEDRVDRFAKLPYPKVLYTANPDTKYDFQVYIPCEGELGDILRYTNIFGERIFEKYFDCVKWLNN